MNEVQRKSEWDFVQFSHQKSVYYAYKHLFADKLRQKPSPCGEGFWLSDW